MTHEELLRFIDRFNNATTEEIVSAMIAARPEAEEWGRRFEDIRQQDGNPVRCRENGGAR